MVKALIRDAPFGRLIRILTKNRVFKYPEKDPNFQCPNSYAEGRTASIRCSVASRKPTNQSAGPTNTEDTEKQELQDDSTIQAPPAGIGETVGDPMRNIEKVLSASSSAADSSEMLRPVSSNITRTKSLPYTAGRLHQDEQAAIERKESRPIAPMKTADGSILVDWYSTDDPENP
ncbi:hypothetical protein PMIN02_007883 [Paraphaeosphaeria minitans]